MISLLRKLGLKFPQQFPYQVEEEEIDMKYETECEGTVEQKAQHDEEHLGDPLCCLSAEQLLKVDAPCISSMMVLNSLLNQNIAVDARLEILANQGSVLG